MTKDLKTLFSSRSNEAWREAHAPADVLSEHTRMKCLFDAAYFALLANATDDARGRITLHPDADFVQGECTRASVPAEVGVRFAASVDSPFDEDRPGRDELLAWTSAIRARLL